MKTQRPNIRKDIILALITGLAIQCVHAADFPGHEELVKTNAMVSVKGYTYTGGMLKKKNGKHSCNGGERGEASWNGSGFLIDDDGTLLTNFHVASKALKAEAIFETGARYDVRFIKAYNRDHDLATMKLYGTGQFPTVQLGDSDEVAPRDAVMAVGSPGGVGLNVTEGKISQVVKNDDGMPVTLRHTAPIAPGNSGGALYRGDKVVGVNSSTWTGYQFHMAIPINIAKLLLLPEFDKPVVLKKAFLLDSDALAERLEPLDSATGKLEGRSVHKHTLQLNQLTDYVIVVKPGSSADLDLHLHDKDGELIGCAESTDKKAEVLIKSVESSQPVTIMVRNISKETVPYGLHLMRIKW